MHGRRRIAMQVMSSVCSTPCEKELTVEKMREIISATGLSREPARISMNAASPKLFLGEVHGFRNAIGEQDQGIGLVERHAGHCRCSGPQKAPRAIRWPESCGFHLRREAKKGHCDRNCNTQEPRCAGSERHKRPWQTSKMHCPGTKGNWREKLLMPHPFPRGRRCAGRLRQPP